MTASAFIQLSTPSLQEHLLSTHYVPTTGTMRRDRLGTPSDDNTHPVWAVTESGGGGQDPSWANQGVAVVRAGRWPAQIRCAAGGSAS